MNDILIIIRNLVITLAVISVPVGMIFFFRRIEVKRAENVAKSLSPEEQRHLLTSANKQEVYGIDKIKYCVNTIAIGMTIYVIVLAVGYFKGFDMVEYFKATLIILIAIIAIAIKDMIKILPWIKVYRIPVYKCFPNAQGEQLVCYYDFVRNEFAAQPISSQRLRFAKNGEMYEALAVAGRKKLKIVAVDTRYQMIQVD